MQRSYFQEPDGERRLINHQIATRWLTALWRIELSHVMTQSTKQRTHAERQRKVARSMRAEARAMQARARQP
jgi:hypothetical protein